MDQGATVEGAGTPPLPGWKYPHRMPTLREAWTLLPAI